MTQEFAARRAAASNRFTNSLTPVIGGTGCLGHVLMSAKGFRAFDRNDIELGLYASAADAVTAILESS